ncbi:adenylyltransferase/cytidyltransferase family protein, partial [Candidatus Woesearchaeota archaeon]|nr:adenylyltransferase/cytidyltransferase family protein [Candidatus Woesearchaeota archaeon]
MIPIKSPETYTSDKILDFDAAAKLISEIKSAGKTIGLCHGGFDLLHPGHVKHFESAKKLCDILVISIT